MLSISRATFFDTTIFRRLLSSNQCPHSILVDKVSNALEEEDMDEDGSQSEESSDEDDDDDMSEEAPSDVNPDDDMTLS